MARQARISCTIFSLSQSFIRRETDKLIQQKRKTIGRERKATKKEKNTRERERERERQTDRQRETETERERERETI